MSQTLAELSAQFIGFVIQGAAGSDLLANPAQIYAWKKQLAEHAEAAFSDGKPRDESALPDELLKTTSGRTRRSLAGRRRPRTTRRWRRSTPLRHDTRADWLHTTLAVGAVLWQPSGACLDGNASRTSSAASAGSR
jgi:hypothetical protein